MSELGQPMLLARPTQRLGNILLILTMIAEHNVLDSCTMWYQHDTILFDVLNMVHLLIGLAVFQIRIWNMFDLLVVFQ